MENLYADYHKLEFRPPKKFATTAENLHRICRHIGINYNALEDKSYSQEKQSRSDTLPTTTPFKTTKTYRRLIDLELKNSGKYGQTLNRVVIQGSAFESLQLDIGKILSEMEREKFVLTEVHSRILLPPHFISWETIDQHFREDAYTAKCRIVSPLTDPSNNYAKTWQAGKRPQSRTAHTQGKRLIFYQADKIHSSLPPGTTEMELQLFGDTAHKFVYSKISRDVDLTLRTLGSIRSFFEFKTLGGDSNTSRRETAKFWKKVVANVLAIHLPRLERPTPEQGRSLKKFREQLYARYQNLGCDGFVNIVADFAIELRMGQRITDRLSELAEHAKRAEVIF